MERVEAASAGRELSDGNVAMAIAYRLRSARLLSVRVAEAAAAGGRSGVDFSVDDGIPGGHRASTVPHAAAAPHPAAALHAAARERPRLLEAVAYIEASVLVPLPLDRVPIHPLKQPQHARV